MNIIINWFPIKMITMYKNKLIKQGTLFAIVDRNADNEEFLKSLFISAINNRLKQKKNQQIFFAVKYLDSDYY